MQQTQRHITLRWPVWIILFGLLALSVHPVTHAFTFQEDVDTEERNLPVHPDDEECIECVLTQLTGSDVQLSESNSYLKNYGQSFSKIWTVFVPESYLSISLRAPPSIYA